MRASRIGRHANLRSTHARLPVFFAVACALLAICSAPALLLAQTQSGADAGGAASFTKSVSDSARAARDSTQAGADSLTRAAGASARRDSIIAAAEAEGAEAWMGPVKYKTDYTLNRTTADWNQDLSFEFSARGVSVSTQTVGTLYSDTETKNDRRNGTSDVAISYAASKRLSVGLNLNFSRLNDGFLRKQYNSDRVSARAAYSLPQSNRLSATLTASAGSVDDVKPTFRGSGTTSGLSLDSKYSFALPCTLQVNASGEFTNRRSQDVRTSLKTRDKDLKELLNATLSITPMSKTSLRLGFSNSNSRLQYPLSGRQETWTSKSKVMDASLGVETMRQITLNATGRYNDSEVLYDVDKAKSSTFLSKSLSTQLSIPSFLGTTLGSNFDIENANNVMGSGRNGDINSRTLSGRISRGITPAIVPEVIGSISLAQYFFHDPGSIGDDRDIYKDAISIGVILGQQGSPYSGSASVRRNLEEMIYVRSMNSGNNQTSEIYSANGSFVYRRNKLIFTQNASATMNYTLFHFNEKQNVLSRTTSISSTLDFPWATKASFRLTHVYRIQDNGSYTTPEGGNEAVYRRTGGSISEELYLTTQYSFTRDLSFSVGQRFQQSRSFTFGARGKRFSAPQKVLDLLEDLKMAYVLDENSSVQVSVSRTLSAFGTSYWNATASFSRDFF